MNQKSKIFFFENDLKIIKSNKTFYKSKIVFDSRPMEYDKNKNLLFQHFYGAEISFEKPCIDKNKDSINGFSKFNVVLTFLYSSFFFKKGIV